MIYEQNPNALTQVYFLALMTCPMQTDKGTLHIIVTQGSSCQGFTSASTSTITAEIRKRGEPHSLRFCLEVAHMMSTHTLLAK